MICPFCKSDSDKVTDKRAWERGSQQGVRRRRECKACGKRFSTLEVVVTFGPDGSPVLPGMNGHVNGNGHKSAPKPKRSKSEIRKQIDLALRRARVKAVLIEGEDLLNDPELISEE